MSGEDYTAKDFRTWAGTLAAALALQRHPAPSSVTEAKKNVLAVVKEVAHKLGNTPATCRKFYIHPIVIDAYIAVQRRQLGARVEAKQSRKRSVFFAERVSTQLSLEFNWVETPAARRAPQKNAALAALLGCPRKSHNIRNFPTTGNTSVFLCGTLVLQHLRLHPFCLRFFQVRRAVSSAPIRISHVSQGGEARLEATFMKHWPLSPNSSGIRPRKGFPGSVAVLRALQLGDLLCAVPCFRAMRQAWPTANITLVGLPWAKNFAARFAQYLDSFQEFPGFDGIPERGFDPTRMQAFAACGSTFDIAIQLHGDGSVTNRFLPRLRARLTAGFSPAAQPCPDPARFIPYPDGEHEIRRLLKLMHHLGLPLAGEALEFPLTHSDYHEANQIATAGGLRLGHFVCLHVGARDLKRRWALTNFLQVGEALAARGLRIVLTGASEEADQTAVLRERLGDFCLDLTGKTSLGALGALLKRARLLISNDTGISHLAAALEVPSVIVFTASDPHRWAPLNTTRHRVLGDPFGSPVAHATPAGVLREAFTFLDESPLRLEARGGGFPLLPAVNWSRVKQVLLVHGGSEADLVALAPSVAALRSQSCALTLLTCPAGASVAALFPGIDRLLVAGRGSLVEPIAEGAVRTLVDQLRAGGFGAAILFNKPGQNPYTAAYVCYLAGIPVRIGASKEFGGALLSHWVRKLPESLDPEERYLAVLRAVALPSSPRDPWLAVPPAVAAQMNDELQKAGVDPDHGFVLLDDAAVRWDSDALAEQLRDITGMKVLRADSFPSASTVGLAAIVQLSDLVITASPLTSRLADAFRRPLIATGAAAASLDGWRPRRSFSKVLTGPEVSEEQLFQAVRTLLWLPKIRSPESEVRSQNESQPTAEARFLF